MTDKEKIIMMIEVHMGGESYGVSPQFQIFTYGRKNIGSPNICILILVTCDYVPSMSAGSLQS
jgi:hypothetical protein